MSQAYRSILKPKELLTAEGYEKDDIEQEAARRVLDQLRAGKWKPPAREDTYGLERNVTWFVESFLREGDAPPD